MHAGARDSKMIDRVFRASSGVQITLLYLVGADLDIIRI